jgi:hypothetical protein
MIYGSFQKGMFQSPYIQDGFFKLQNCDVHEQAGTLQSSKEISVQSTTPNENAIVVPTDNGEVFFLSKTSGKIWKRATNGTYSLVRTNANGAHIGGGSFNNRLWYATSTKLGFYNLSSTWSDSFATFGNTAYYRPFLRGGVNQAYAYFGDTNQLAWVDRGNIFAANVLDLPEGEIVKDVEEWGNDIFMITQSLKCKAYRWNQYGSTYYKPDLIGFPNVEAIVQSTQSNITYVICRDKDGYLKFMYYTGTELAEIDERRIKSTTAITSYHVEEFNGVPHVAIDDQVYSFKKQGLVGEYTASGTIQSIGASNGQLYISTGTGIEVIGTNRADAIVQTPMNEGKIKNIVCNYETLPTGTTLSLKVKVNGGDWYTRSFINEPQNNRYIMHGGFKEPNVNLVQAEVTLNSSGTSTPVIRSIEVV